MSERTHWKGCWRERTHQECAVARCYELERDRDAAIARAQAAEKDEARLDWLAAHPREATIRVGGDMKLAVFWGVSAAPGTDMRAAIDAARAED